MRDHGIQVAEEKQVKAIRGRHGMSGTKEHRCWQHMNRRCYRPADKKYPNYGGRGIKVCDRWRHSFANFFADLGFAPTPEHSIERIDNDGDYEPANCRWEGRKQQNRNKRTNHVLEFNGQRKTVAEWSEITGFPYSAIITRIEKHKWSIAKALTVPVRPRKGACNAPKAISALPQKAPCEGTSQGDNPS